MSLEVTGRLQDLDGEIWVPIKGYESRYMVSNMGRVKSLGIKRVQPLSGGIRIYPSLIIKQGVNPKGYYNCALCDGTKAKTFRVNRLVCMNFHNNPKNKSTVNHKNGIKSDNRASNLEWMTQSENNRHARETGLHSCRGETHHQQKLTEVNVKDIRNKRREGFTLSRLSLLYNVSIASIHCIVANKTWRHVA